MTYPVKSVSNSIINQAFIHRQDLTHLKLQKLLYYVSGYYLASKNESLIDYAFEAWDYGPVVPAIYHEFKKYGNAPIKLASKFCLDSGAEIVIPPVTDDKLFDKVLSFVWENYGKYSAEQLSQMTHELNTPWDITKKGNPGIKNADIPLCVLKEYFSRFVKQSSKKAGH